MSDAMLRAVDDLLKAPPHLRTDARYTMNELHAYHEGYYRGLSMALLVLGHAVENYKLATRTRRADRATRKAG